MHLSTNEIAIFHYPTKIGPTKINDLTVCELGVAFIMIYNNKQMYVVRFHHTYLSIE